MLTFGIAGGSREQRGGDRLGGGQRRHLVADERAEQRGLSVARIGLNTGQTGGGLDHVVVHTMTARRSVGAVSADAAIDEAGVHGPQVLVSDPQSFDGTGTEVLDHHVGGGGELLQERDAFGLLQVDDDRTLPAIVVEEDSGHASLRRTEITHEVTDAGGLDLDDVGTLVRQNHSGQWSGDHHGQIEHFDAVEWSCGGGHVGMIPRSVDDSATVLVRARIR